MSTIKKPNDIFVATLHKADASVYDLAKSGITSENTQILSKEDYKQSEFIKSKFTENGKFDEGKFDQYYNLALAKFQELDQEVMLENLVNGLEYSQASFFKPIDARTTDTKAKGVAIADNPLYQAVGIEGVNQRAETTITEKEAAQQNRIWDPINQKWLNKTAEGRNLIEKAFGAPVAYAKYTKDGWQANPVTGIEDYHQAGEYIKDENGYYFTQLAGDLELADGHEIVKLGDIVTREDSWLNKIDFFDSDGKEKSVAGIAFKTIANVAPYFLPYVKIPYTVANILVGLGENLPQFVKSIEGLITNEKYTELSSTSNKLINYFNRYSSTMSERGNESFFSLENLAHQATDVVHQLYAQRGVASLSKYLKAVPTLGESQASYKMVKEAAEQRAKIAKALSLGYMTLTSTGDMYQQTLQAGFDRTTASIATLTTAGLLFGVMNFNEGANGLGTWFLDKSTGYDRELLRQPISKLVKVESKNLMQATDDLLKLGDDVAKKNWQQSVLSFRSKLDDIVRIGGEGYWKGAITEGIEEVSEEAAQDAIKGIIDAMTYLGYKTSDHSGSFGGWSNVFSQSGLERYLQTFVGGAMGGAMFYGIENKLDPAIQKLWNPNVPGPVKQADLDLIDIALRDQTEEFCDEVDRTSRYISDKFIPMVDENGNAIPASDKVVTQRQFIAEELKSRARTVKALVDELLTGADLNTADKDYKQAMISVFKPFIEQSQVTQFLDRRFQASVKKLVNAKKDLNDLEKSVKDMGSEASAELKNQLKEKKEEFQQRLATVQRYLSGKSYVDTYEEVQIISNKNLLNFLRPKSDLGYGVTNQGLTIENYYENVVRDPNSNVHWSNLTDSQKQHIQKLYNLYATLGYDLDNLVDQAPVLVDLIHKLSDLLSPAITQFNSDARKKQVIADCIKMMQQKREEIQQQLDAINYEEMLKGEQGEIWDILSQEEKENQIAERKQQSQIQSLAQFMSPDVLLDLIQAHPQAFSLMDRYSMDYAEALINAGVIVLTNKWGENAKKAFKTLINSLFANSGLNTFNSQQIEILLQDAKKKLSDNNILNDIFVEDKTNPLDWGINTNNITESIQLLKIKSLEEYLKDNIGIIDDYYDTLLGYYQNLDAPQNELINKLSNTARLYWDSGDWVGLKYEIQSPEQSQLTAEDIDLFQKLFKSTDLTTTLSGIPEGPIKSNVQQFQETYADKRIVNPFKSVITQLFVATGTDGKTALTLSDFLTDQIRIIAAGAGSSMSSQIPENYKQHEAQIAGVLNVLRGVIYTMSPRKNIDKTETYDSMNQVRKLFLDSMGTDTSNIHLMSEEEAEFFNTILDELSHKLHLIGTVYSNLTKNAFKDFENIRHQIIDGQFKMYVKLHSELDDWAPEIEIKDFAEDDYAGKYNWVLQYKQALHEKFLQIQDAGTTTQDLIAQLITKFAGDENNRNKTIFQYNSTLLSALGTTVDSGEIKDVQAQFLLTELIGLVDKNINVKQIHETIHEVLSSNLKFYPRQDQYYALEMAITTTLAKDTYNEYLKQLGKIYNESEIAEIKNIISGYIRIPGPAGSGKTALQTLYIQTLQKLNPEANILCTAHAQVKVDNIKSDIQEATKLQDESFVTLYNLIPNLQTIQNEYQDALSAVVAFMMSNVKDFTAGKIVTPPADSHISVKKVSENIFEFSYNHENIAFTLSTPLKIGNYTFPQTWWKISIDSNTVNTITEGVSLDSNTVMLLDECTNLSHLEAAVLNQLGEKTGLLTIATGDENQEGYRIETVVDNKKEVYFYGDSHSLGINIPTLISIYRLHNTAQQENESILRTVQDEAAKYIKDGAFPGLRDYAYGDNMPKIVKDYFEAKELQYTKQHAAFGFLGSLLTNTLETDLEAIKDKSSTILGIVNQENDKSVLEGLLKAKGFTNIEIVLLKDVKGAEADYAVAYKIPTTGGIIQDVQRLYTLVTRGKKGFIGSLDGELLISPQFKESNNISVVTTTRQPDDSGNMWLNELGQVIENIQVTEPEATEPSAQSLPVSSEQFAETNTGILDEQGEEENETTVSQKSKELSDTLSKHFDIEKLVPIHLYGFRTGKTLAELNELKTKKTVDTSGELAAKRDFDAVMHMLFVDRLEGSLYEKDIEIINQIKTEAKKQSNVVNMYIYFIRALRQAVIKGDISVVCFNTTDYNKDIDFAYLKPNDNPPADQTKLKRFGIPVYDAGGNPSGMITLGTLGYLSFTDDQQGQKEEYEMFLQSISDGIVTKARNITGEGKKQMEEYYKARGAEHMTSKSDGAVFAITGIRQFKLENSEINAWYFNADQLKHGRLLLSDLTQQGWEKTTDEFKIDIAKDEVQQLNEFKSWYNKFRFAPLTDDELKKFKSLFTHNGKFIVIRPLGRTDIAVPVYVQDIIKWEQFAKHATNKPSGEASPYASGYSVRVMMTAMSELAETPIGISEWKQLMEDKGLSEFKSELSKILSHPNVASRILTDEIKSQLINSMILTIGMSHLEVSVSKESGLSVPNNFYLGGVKADILLQSLYKSESTSYKRLTAENTKALCRLLDAKIPNYAFSSIETSSSESTQISNYAFEEENLILNLGMFTNVGKSVGGPSAATVEKRLSDADKETYDRILSVLSNSVIKAGKKVDPLQQLLQMLSNITHLPLYKGKTVTEIISSISTTSPVINRLIQEINTITSSLTYYEC